MTSKSQTALTHSTRCCGPAAVYNQNSALMYLTEIDPLLKDPLYLPQTAPWRTRRAPESFAGSSYTCWRCARSPRSRRCSSLCCACSTSNPGEHQHDNIRAYRVYPLNKHNLRGPTSSSHSTVCMSTIWHQTSTRTNNNHCALSRYNMPVTTQK